MEFQGHPDESTFVQHIKKHSFQLLDGQQNSLKVSPCTALSAPGGSCSAFKSHTHSSSFPTLRSLKCEFCRHTVPLAVSTMAPVFPVPLTSPRMVSLYLPMLLVFLLCTSSKFLLQMADSLLAVCLGQILNFLFVSSPVTWGPLQ